MTISSCVLSVMIQKQSQHNRAKLIIKGADGMEAKQAECSIHR
jgi:hypothetical protein